MARWYTGALRAQSLFYAITGLWPLVHMRSFEALTGPKTDDWLVHMVGLLTVAIAVAIWPRVDATARVDELRALPITAAGSYLSIDVIYWARGVISPIYLLDAVVEIALIITYSVAWLRGRPARAAR